MNVKFQASPLSVRWRMALHILLGITVLNYVAQIPYYMHFYGIAHVLPSPFAIVFLTGTFVLFLVGYFLTLQAKRVGSWLLLLFLLMEAGGYLLHNLTGAFLRDLPPGDILFLVVSFIGYLNFAVSLVYLILMVKDRRYFFFQQGKVQESTNS